MTWNELVRLELDRFDAARVAYLAQNDGPSHAAAVRASLDLTRALAGWRAAGSSTGGEVYDHRKKRRETEERTRQYWEKATEERNREAEAANLKIAKAFKPKVVKP